MLLLLATPAFAAITNGDWVKAAGGTGTALSGDILVEDFPNRVVYVAVGFEHATATISSPTLEGVAMTSIAKHEISTVSIEVFRLIAPAVNATATFAGTLSASCNWHVVGAPFYGVHQTTPNGTTAEAGANSAGPVTVNVADVVAGERVVDFVALASDATTMSVGASQTQVQNNGNNDMRTGGSYEDGSGTVTMSWTLSQAEMWVTIALALKPANPIIPVLSTQWRQRRQ